MYLEVLFPPSLVTSTTPPHDLMLFPLIHDIVAPAALPALLFVLCHPYFRLVLLTALPASSPTLLLSGINLTLPNLFLLIPFLCTTHYNYYTSPPPCTILHAIPPIRIHQPRQTHKLVDPINHHKMPNKTILMLQHPMVLIREAQEQTLHPSHLQHIEHGQTLRNRQPVIQLIMHHQHGGVPLLRKSARIPPIVVFLVLP